MAVTLKDIKAIEFPGKVTLRKHPTENTLQLSGAGVTTITQTDATADATLAADTVTSIAATVDAATATSIAATVQATLTDPVATENTGWGASSEANFDAIKTEFDAMGTWATEMDLDYEALLVDVAANRTWATEIDLDLEALIVDVRDLKSALNSVVDALQLQGLLG